MEAKMKLASQKANGRSGAFTRPDLVVVLATLFFLLSSLISFPRNTERMRFRVICESNLKQLVGSIAIYATDHDGILPPSNWGEPRSNPEAGWLYQSPIGPQPGGKFRGAETGLLWPYLKSTNIFRCPLDTPERERSAWLTRNSNMSFGAGQNLSSYTMNGAVNGFARRPSFHENQMRSDAGIMWEQEEGPLSFYFNDGATYPSEGVNKRHGTGAWLGKLNGSVMWISYDDYVQELMSSPGLLWANPDTPNGH